MQSPNGSCLEIGVANGYSSAIIFDTLYKKREGRVVSIDLTRFSHQEKGLSKLYRKLLERSLSNNLIEETGTLVDLKPGGVVPADKYPGWLVDSDIRRSVNSNFFFGNVFNVLPDINENFDLIVIDAMKDYLGRLDLLNKTYKLLNDSGAIVVDGYWVNNAFDDFVNKHTELSSFKIGRIGIAIKK
jgi:hypothetical protein